MTSLDRRIVARELPLDNLDHSSFTPSQVLTEHRLLNPSGKELSVVFPPRGNGGGGWYERLTTRLAKSGDAVLCLAFHPMLLSTDIQKTAAAYSVLQADVADILSRAQDKHQYSRRKAVSLSMGQAAFTVVQAVFPFDKTTALTAADSLALCMWDGIRTRNIREGIEAQGTGLDEVESALRPMAPIEPENIDNLKDSDVTVYISRPDLVIPAPNQRRYVKQLQASGINPRVITSPFGHYATNAAFCMIGRS